MSVSSIAITPGGRSLSAFHQERSTLYAALLLLLGNPADEIERNEVARRLGRLRGAQLRARSLVEQALRDSQLIEQRLRWLGLADPRSERDLEVLANVARQAAQCARALQDGDVAAAADSWDAQSRELAGATGRELRGLAEELMISELPALTSIGRALGLMIDDDLALAGLDARHTRN